MTPGTQSRSQRIRDALVWSLFTRITIPRWLILTIASAVCVYALYAFIIRLPQGHLAHRDPAVVATRIYTRECEADTYTEVTADDPRHTALMREVALLLNEPYALWREPRWPNKCPLLKVEELDSQSTIRRRLVILGGGLVECEENGQSRRLKGPVSLSFRLVDVLHRQPE